jgi:hypothetical protein
MRTTQFVFALIAVAIPLIAQQPAPAPAKSATQAALPTSADQSRQKLHQSALKFLAASDARQRLQQSMDKLLDEGKQSMLRPNSGLSSQFVDEWVKQMRLRIKLDDMVNATAQVYERYFTSDELDTLTQAQLALKRSEAQTLSPELAEKLKTNSPRIQHDINAVTSLIGDRLSQEVGKQIEDAHPDWVKPAGPASAAEPKK